MSEISEKLKGLKFMQNTQKKKSDEREVSFSTHFCKGGVLSYNGSKQKMNDAEGPKKPKNH
ncbi:hypothetical protein HK407_02g04300 [Ordospora pajunii]|uniref:uncharacterized protein n=1 Tax=Ordospora pajunii TaxID=3039483 RepID=UPI002952853B|nr:uncharacterized protein HK407_02g04300 [Ordospora pajunii]KAH9411983.1 hypothetical protein HK407_02g04300 [Ordospora pajunii]